MANKRLKHLNELRVKAMAGDRLAASALERESFIPHHLRQPDPLGARHRKIGTKFKDGVHVTAKTLQAMRCRTSVSIDPSYGLDRLQMLKDRRERREARA